MKNTTGVKNALIVGGGIGGMSAAISLRRLGIEVDLIDLDPQWRVYGAGITITGPTLRAFKMLGILDEVMRHAYTGNGIRVCAMDGSLIRELPTPMPPGSDVPGSGGIMRPVLHKILSNTVLSLDVKVRLGLTVDTLSESARAVEVRFTDDSEAHYDMVVGADGVFSRVRELLFPAAPRPEYTGQSCWRLAVPRPVPIDRRHYFLGGPVKVGLSPVSPTQMYLFLLENRATKDWIAEPRLPVELGRLLAPYGGVLRELCATLDAKSAIVFRPLEAMFLPQPWHSGRTLLIGDAAHPTTPQLASGAGMAVEDALVLAEEMQHARSVQECYEAFIERRYERCRLVVQNSLEIGRREQSGASVAAQTELVEQSLRVLAAPI